MRRSCVLLLFLVGCRPKLEGSYSGLLEQSGAILSGPSSSTMNDSENVVAVVTPIRSGAVSVSYGSCTFEATVGSSSDYVYARHAECPFPGAPGVTFSVDMARLSFTKDSLSWFLQTTLHGPHGDGSGTWRFSGTKIAK